MRFEKLAPSGLKPDPDLTLPHTWLSPQSIPRLRTLQGPKPAHLQWAQDQGVMPSSQFDLFHWNWTLTENWAVNSWFLLWNLFHHRLSRLRLFQLFARNFCQTLLQDFTNKIPRPALTSFFSTPIHSITTAGPLPHFDKWCLPWHIF